MANSIESLISPGDVLIEKVELTSITGDVFDLTKFMGEFNIYEDLFSNYLTGNILLTDWTNLINLVPIIGQEKISIKFRTPVIDEETKELNFQVYKISTRILDKDRTQVYVLHFISIPAIKNSLTKISKSYKGSISDIVVQVVDEELDTYVNEIFATSGQYKFVIPYWSPFKTINFLAKRAKTSDGKDTSYSFYETLDGFNFMPISQLLKREPYPDNYSFAQIPKFNSDSNKENIKELRNNFFSIKEYKILDSMDTLDAIRGGMFASSLISYDITSKQIKKTEFRYLNDFEDFTYITDEGKSNPLTIDKANPNGFKYHDFTDSLIKRFDVQDKKHDDIQMKPNPDEYILQRISLLKQLKMNRMQVIIPGNSTLRVGMLLDLVLPSPEQMVTEFKEDLLVSGRYIITNIRHKVEKGGYSCVLELSKNSFKNPIPENSNLQK